MNTILFAEDYLRLPDYYKKIAVYFLTSSIVVTQ